ncbi:histone-lysine N-methyltransferase SETMAR-like [Hipposideros larvatus]
MPSKETCAPPDASSTFDDEGSFGDLSNSPLLRSNVHGGSRAGPPHPWSSPTSAHRRETRRVRRPPGPGPRKCAPASPTRRAHGPVRHSRRAHPQLLGERSSGLRRKHPGHGKNVHQACEKLREVYGDNALQECECQRWFTKFRAGDFDLNNASRSGRPTEVDDDKIKALIESNPHYTTREIAETLNIHHLSIHDHLKKLGYVSKLVIWVPHKLKEVHLTARINICNMLIKHEENEPFLKRLIT